jgi:hypothetical protein
VHRFFWEKPGVGQADIAQMISGCGRRIHPFDGRRYKAICAGIASEPVSIAGNPSTTRHSMPDDEFLRGMEQRLVACEAAAERVLGMLKREIDRRASA